MDTVSRPEKCPICGVCPQVRPDGKPLQHYRIANPDGSEGPIQVFGWEPPPSDRR